MTLHFSVQQRYESFVQVCEQSGIDLTAIACQEDGIAIPLMFQLARTGLRVPFDVSMVGYDASFYANEIGLTTVRQDPIAMATCAALKALDLIETGKTAKPFEVFPAQMLVRSSTTEAKG